MFSSCTFLEVRVVRHQSLRLELIALYFSLQGFSLLVAKYTISFFKISFVVQERKGGDGARLC